MEYLSGWKIWLLNGYRKWATLALASQLAVIAIMSTWSEAGAATWLVIHLASFALNVCILFRKYLEATRARFPVIVTNSRHLHWGVRRLARCTGTRRFALALDRQSDGLDLQPFVPHDHSSRTRRYSHSHHRGTIHLSKVQRLVGMARSDRRLNSHRRDPFSISRSISTFPLAWLVM
jgi:hypothetical protein